MVIYGKRRRLVGEFRRKRKYLSRVGRYGKRARVNTQVAMRAARGARYLSYAGMGMAGAGALAAGGVGYGLYRGYKAFKRMRVRRRALIKSGSAFNAPRPNKVFVIHTDPGRSAFNGATLHFNRLVNVPKQTTSDEQNLRDGDSIKVSGVKIQWELANDSEVPLYFSWAIIVPKDAAANSSTLVTEDFFRAYGTGRAINFDNLISGWDRYTREINTDIHDVVARGKWQFNGRSSGITSGVNVVTPTRRYIDKWVPIAREYRFDDDGTIQGPQPWLVYWADVDNANAGQTPAANVLTINRKTLCYYKDLK